MIIQVNNKKQYTLVEGQSDCYEFFKGSMTIPIQDVSNNVDIEVAWLPGKGRQPTIGEYELNGARHGQFELKFGGTVYSELESVPESSIPQIQRQQSA